MNYKKILAIILTVITIAAALAVPASVGAATAEYVIDESRKGSLTINKYEMGDVSKATNSGTGETSDSAKVPSDAKLFAGVTFKITQIAGLDDKYFQGKGTPLPTPEEAKKMTAIGSPISKTTNDKGIVEFTNLPLGIYLVTETAAPNHVMKKSPDFVIPVPMTDVESKRWLYDITVYPKNETKYSDLKVHKSDYTTSESLANAEFKLERYTESKVWATVKEGLTTDKTGSFTVKDLPVNNFYRLTETKAPELYILDKTNNVCTVYIDTQGRVCNENKVPYNLNNDPTLFEFLPNSKPEIDKFIDKSKGSNTDLVKETTFGHRSEDDRNYYTIIVTTPNVDMSKLSVFKVTDQINNTLQAPRVESVKENNKTAIPKSAVGYSVSITKDNHVTVNFSTAANTVIKKNTKYYISISCFHSLTNEPILNDAQLEYTKITGTNETEKITTDKTKTITGAYEFLKTDSSQKGLKDAVFSLYASEEDAKNNRNPISVTQSEGAPYSTTFKSGADGKVRIIYLDFGDDVENGEKEYWIAEVQAPNGFMLLAKPEKIVVNRRSGSYTNTQMKIVNIPQPDLPKTGGYGTAIFSVIGFVSLSTAGVLFFIKRRKSTDK